MGVEIADWNKLKSEYVTTSISYREMCEKHDISFSTLQQSARKAKWTYARKKYRESIVTKTTNKAANLESNKLYSLMKSADKMAKVIEKVFDDTEQFNRHMIQVKRKGLLRDPEGVNEDGSVDLLSELQTVEERIYQKVDTKAIKDMTGALKDLSSVIRDLYDIPSIQDKTAMDIAIERIKMDKKKAEEDIDDEDETGVVVLSTVLPDEDEGGDE